MTSPIDNELVITVRYRLADQDTCNTITGDVIDQAPGRVVEALRPLLAAGGIHGIDLAAVEITLPDFRPYDAPGKLTHEFADPVPSGGQLIPGIDPTYTNSTET